ncbi:MAG TPA: hypothetical protein VEH06_12305 [Candidatus Bathyarchaeia archaeon]|nr:hypothetical protein [Candidatus Bathyarchaeia archaeon]
MSLYHPPAPCDQCDPTSFEYRKKRDTSRGFNSTLVRKKSDVSTSNGTSRVEKDTKKILNLKVT